MSRYRSNKAAGLARWVGIAAVTLTWGCASIGTVNTVQEHSPPQDPVLRTHIGYMKRAAEADSQTRAHMKREADRRLQESPVQARLELGFLLTSPNETEINTREGEKILRSMLANEPSLQPPVTDLIELRLREVEARRALRAELGDVKGKIKELMSIESSMEEKKSESQTRPR